MERSNLTLKERITKAAIDAGVDMVGFSSVDRFKNGEPTAIFPKAKTVVGVLFRVLRGSFRGIEEGTTYYQYSTTGVETIEETVMPGALLQISNAIEDEGYLAIPQRRNQMLKKRPEDVNPEMLHSTFYAAAAKETELNFTEASINCGFGELGLSGSVLTDAFGPFHRVAFILTDAEIESDPIVKPHLCDGCGACIAACPGKAISADGKLDGWQCAAYYRGASRHTNPYMPPDGLEGIENREQIMDGKAKLTPEEAKKVMDELYYYPPIKHGYVSSICGRACDRACYAHLEEKGVLTKSFVHKLRIRPAWNLPVKGDQSDPTPWDSLSDNK